MQICALVTEFSANWMITELDDGNQTKENNFYVSFWNIVYLAIRYESFSLNKAILPSTR